MVLQTMYGRPTAGGGNPVSDSAADRSLIIEAGWHLTNDIVPPPEVVVDTVAENGTRQPLFRRGHFWYTADGTIYVYSAIVWWRSLPEEPHGA